MRKARAVTFWLVGGSLLATLGLTEVAGHTVLASGSPTSTPAQTASWSAGPPRPPRRRPRCRRQDYADHGGVERCPLCLDKTVRVNDSVELVQHYRQHHCSAYYDDVDGVR